MLGNSPTISDDVSNGIHKLLLLFPMDLLEVLLNRPFPEPDLQPVYVRMHLTLGNLTRELGLHDKAIQACQGALNRAKQLGHDFPGDVKYSLLQCDALTGQGLGHQSLKRFEQAENAFRQAWDIAQQLAADHPNDATARAVVAEVQIKLAGLYDETGRLLQAESIRSQAREFLDRSRQLQPTLDTVLSGWLDDHYNIDQIKPHLKWLHMALDAFCAAAEAWRRMEQHQLEMPDMRNQLIGGLAALTALYHHPGLDNPDTDDADDLQDTFNPDHFAFFQYKSGLVCESLDLPNQAMDAYGKAISIFEPLVREYPAVREYQLGLFLSQSSMGRMSWHVESDCFRWKRYPKMICQASV